MNDVLMTQITDSSEECVNEGVKWLRRVRRGH